MKRNPIILLVIAAAAIAWAGAAPGQTPTTTAEQKTEAPSKVYHAGGKHDQKGHEASLRAKEQGRKLEEPAVHPGGRHDEGGHKAAVRAEQKEAAK